MQTKNINHDNIDPQRRRRGVTSCTCSTHVTSQNQQGMVHQNCNMYGSASALPHHASDFTLQNSNGDITAIKSMIVPTHVTQMRYGQRSNYGPPSAHNHQEYYQHQHQHSFQSHQSTSCTSTPILSSTGHLLKRQASLGQLDDRIMSKNKEDGRFGVFQQKIRSFLTPNFRKSESMTTIGAQPQRVESTPALNTQSLNISDSSQCENNNDNQTALNVSRASTQMTNPDTVITSSNIEDEVDSLHLRDVCSKWFGQRQNGLSITVASSLSSVNKPFVADSPKHSHNIKTTLYDKVTPKDSICKPNSDTTYMSRYQSTVPQLHQSQAEHRYVEIRRIPNASDVRPSDRPSNRPSDRPSNRPSDRPSNRPSDRPSNNSFPSQANREQHVVVVGCLEGTSGPLSRENSLTVRSERPTLQVVCDNSVGTNNEFNPMLTSTKIREPLTVQADTTGSNENYKSSSESGRGTMISNGDTANNDGGNANSSVDLTSLDSDQSTPEKMYDQTDRKVITEGNSNNATIEQMQRELQRILEDGSMQSSEVEVDDMTREFQSRLSVVNESDSWISNTPPPPQTTLSASCKETKSSTDNKNVTKVIPLTNLKQRSLTRDKSHSSSSKQKPNLSNVKDKIPPNSRSLKNPYSINGNKRYDGNYNFTAKYKPRTSAIQKGCINLVDCDIASTTTCRDGDSIAEYPDDLSSEYTANTSVWDKGEVSTIRNQLHGLENMYSEIICLLGSRMKNTRRYAESSHRSRRRFGSVSSVTGRSSVTSRGTRDHTHSYKKHDYRKSKIEDNRLESHVMTLARSVAQLSAEMRSNHSLAQELESLRRDFDWIHEQLRTLKNMPQATINSKPHHHSNGHISASGREWDKFRRDAMDLINPERVDKLTRFFGDEPPLLRQFLKKLGYEKYARNFETEKIGITELPYLSEERFHKLGIPMGPRMRIMTEAQQLLKQRNTKDHYSTTKDHYSTTKDHYSNTKDHYSVYAVV